RRDTHTINGSLSAAALESIDALHSAKTAVKTTRHARAYLFARKTIRATWGRIHAGPALGRTDWIACGCGGKIRDARERSGRNSDHDVAGNCGIVRGDVSGAKDWLV